MAAFNLAQPMIFSVDVRAGLYERPQRAILMRGDNLANQVIANLYLDKDPFSVDGVAVSGKFTRCADNVDITLPGKVRGNRVSVDLNEHCYAMTGRYELRIRITIEGKKRTILFITGQVESDGDGGILDVENVIPSIDDIIAQYAEMKRVTRETEDARDRAIEASMQANFTVLDRFATYEELIAKHPTGEAGQAFAVGTVDNNVVYIWGIDTKTWVNIGPVQGAQGPTGATGAPGEDGKDGKDGENGISPSVTIEEIEGGHRVTITDANGTQTFDVLDGVKGDAGEDSIGADQELNTTSDVKFNSVTTTQPLDADQLGGKEPGAYVLAENYETWTFTLENGTTVARKVIVVD